MSISLAKRGLARIPAWIGRATAAAGMAMVLAAAAPTAKTPPHTGITQRQTVSLDTSAAQLIHLSEPAKTVFVANPDIADIQLPSPTNVLVYGKSAGTTTVFAISETGVTTSYSIVVRRPTAEILSALHQAVPGALVSVTTTPGGLTVSGQVHSPADAAKLRAAAQQFIADKQTLNFAVTVDATTQVTLRVRVAEVSRSLDRSLGVNWSAVLNSGSLAVQMLTNNAPVLPGVGGKLNLSAMIDALDQEGLATILAEPNLTATSGETANFLAGGEFPIPVPQGNNQVTVEYKRYGISVAFTPTVLDGNRISIKVRPEVSQLTSVGNLKLDNVEIPALTVRRVETTVELGSGESFAIAGLFQNNGSNQLKALPGLGDLPILGALFRSTRFQRDESELVIIVTPYLVRPVANRSALHSPLEGLRFPSDLERILLGRMHGAPAGQQSPVAPQGPRLNGSAGFMLE